MAHVRIPDEDRTLRDPDAIRAYLAEHGIEYERWSPDPAAGSADSTILFGTGDGTHLRFAPTDRRARGGGDVHGGRGAVGPTAGVLGPQLVVLG